MHLTRIPYITLVIIVVSNTYFGAAPHAYAETESAVIQDMSPSGAITPDTPVHFLVKTSGFFNPVYSVSDSFTAPGSTSGSIDQIGFFSWVPTIYDSGRHTLTVSVTDSQNRTASSTVDILVGGSTVLLSVPLPGPIVIPGHTVTFTSATPGFVSPQFAVYDSAFNSSLRSSALSATGSFSWTPVDDDIGSHTISVSATDGYGHSAQAVQMPIIVARPVVLIQNISPGRTTTVGAPVTFTASAPAFASTTAYSFIDVTTIGSSTLSANALDPHTGAFRWIPTDGDRGAHTLVVTASDTFGNAASSTLALWVDESTTLPSGTPPTLYASTTSSSPIATNLVVMRRYLFAKNIPIGSRSTDVMELQKRLTANGYYTGPLSGFFGALTTTAVKKFQAAHGISRIGTVGPATRAALNN